MTPETTSHILLMIILFGFSAFFSIAETALFSLSSQKLKEMVDKKWIASSLLQKMKQDPRRLLTTILLGNDLINIAISILATEILASYLGFLNETLFLFISIGLTTFVII
ncbi:MAG: DUF21 domain-containing protein, partial [bacterium]|nr:DUF21 domain-containing protein [bacterium]